MIHKERQIYAPLEVPEFQDNQTMIAYAKCQYCCGECWGFFRTWVPCIFCLCVEYPYQEVDQGKAACNLHRLGRTVQALRAPHQGR